MLDANDEILYLARGRTGGDMDTIRSGMNTRQDIREEALYRSDLHTRLMAGGVFITLKDTTRSPVTQGTGEMSGRIILRAIVRKLVCVCLKHK